eukprot:TRINITY_DN8084_c0_g1_i1.p1 TRINITY_DN8084_c0_g1~~TRINITY_DN8084_c0_g1_i1.p1  ORF type:complete len:352 (-),score=94.36 TRINITY_DN8084_c0_g1_i1:429-1373(-)
MLRSLVGSEMCIRDRCWSLPVSLMAAVYGFGMSYYFARVRLWSSRDPWYGLFLTSFTVTQLLDAFFWSLADGADHTVRCDPANLYFTKIVVSAAVFSQVFVITVFPSHLSRAWCNKFRAPYRLLPAAGALAMLIFGKCTYSTVTHGGIMQLPTLVYWGFVPSPFLFSCGVALWSVAALLFITPWWAATNILLVGGLNLVILNIIDGTILLVSKLCFYCLLLSILWLLEPLWTHRQLNSEPYVTMSVRRDSEYAEDLRERRESAQRAEQERLTLEKDAEELRRRAEEKLGNQIRCELDRATGGEPYESVYTFEQL